MTVMVNASEPLSRLFVLQPGAAKWTAYYNVGYVSANVTTDGWHCLHMKVADQVGNAQVVTLRFCWEFDTTAPNIWLLGMQQLPFVTSNASLLFSAQWSERLRALAWWAVDKGTWNQLGDSSSFTSTVESDGEHSLHLKTKDTVGNERVNRSVWVWALDTTPPTAHVIQGPESPALVSSAEFQVMCTSSSFGVVAGSDCVGYEYTVALASGCGSDQTHSGQVGVSGFIRVLGIRSGENTLTVSAVDGVGLKQLVSSTFSWTVQLTSDILDVSIISGPPTTTAWNVATFHLYAHKNETRTNAPRFEVKLDNLPWLEVSMLCNNTLCNYSTPALPVSPHEIQIRAKDVAMTAVAGAPALWRWTVAECSPTDYAGVDPIGVLICSACPDGGNCTAKGTTLATVMAQPGWWSPPSDDSAQRRSRKTATFYRCPLPGSEFFFQCVPLSAKHY
jgi:hypothetical protein